MLTALGLGLLLIQTPQPSLSEKLTSWLEEKRTAGGFPGANLAVIDREGKITAISVGFREEGKPEKLQASDRLESGSIGKSYFAAAFVEAALEKNIDLDRKVSEDLGGQEWFDRLPNAKTFTYRHLLRHQSGLDEYFRHEPAIKSMKKDPLSLRRPEELLSYLHGDKPLFEAGTSFSYADSNYLVLGLAFQRLFGEDGYDAVERRYLRPLGLPGTIPSREVSVAGLAPGHSTPLEPFWFKGPTVVDGKSVLNPQFEGWGGGYANTAECLAKWAKALYQGKATSPKALAILIDGVPSNLGPNQSYGCAVQVRPGKMGRSFGHSGWFPGYLSDMAYFTDHGVAVAIQFNTDNFRTLKGSTYVYLIHAAEIATQR
jgi:D-alanyl-D-alanine carboxypeptidase